LDVLVRMYCRGSTKIFRRKAIGFLMQAKLFELNFFMMKTFLQVVKPERQNCPICLLPGP